MTRWYTMQASFELLTRSLTYGYILNYVDVGILIQTYLNRRIPDMAELPSVFWCILARPTSAPLKQTPCVQDGRRNMLPAGFLQTPQSNPPIHTFYNMFFFSLNTSGLEENCIKSRNQIRILGIAKGFDQLPPHVQAMTTNTEGENTNTLSRKEKTILKRMRCEVGESEYCIRIRMRRGIYGII